MFKYFWFFILCAVLLVAAIAHARDPKQVTAFRRANPCPATGKTSGACHGWVVDHRVPLCAGGPDAPSNMVWQEYKESLLKDKWEREICAFLKHSNERRN